MSDSRRTWRSFAWLVAAIIVLTAIFYPVASLVVGWDTLMFRTTAVEATVTSVEQVGRCDSSTKYRIGVEWQRDGETHADSYIRCGTRIHEVGDETTVYVDTHGELATSVPPWLVHAGWYLALLCLLVVPWWWMRRRARRAAR